MSNIVRRDPLAIDDMLDDLFKGYFVRPLRLGTELPDMRTIRMDVKEGEQAYTVHAELPGVNKEDIHVTIDGNTVNLSAEVKTTREQKEGDKVLRSERYFGKVSRAFTLQHEIDETGATAKYADGVLELVLPKKAATASRRLTIQ